MSRDRRREEFTQCHLVRCVGRHRVGQVGEPARAPHVAAARIGRQLAETRWLKLENIAEARPDCSRRGESVGAVTVIKSQRFDGYRIRAPVIAANLLAQKPRLLLPQLLA